MILHIPNDSVYDTQEAINDSYPGDELIFDAGTYTFAQPLVIMNDRRYKIIGQTLRFLDGYRIEIEPEGSWRFSGNIVRRV